MEKQPETILEEQNKIIGYSERGIINSLIFNIGEDKRLISEFIGLISLPNKIEIGEPQRYTILLEQSFSDFGDADLVIIIHYEKEENKKVLFFEAKVKTSLSSWSITTHYNKYREDKEYNGYSSNLFYQLYFKSLLMTNWDDINKKEGFEVDSKFRKRKIGDNPIVFKAFQELKECKEAYYVGLIPTLEEDIKIFRGKTDFDIHFLSWETVYEFCKNEKKLKKVEEIFDYNKGQIYKPNK